MTSDADNVRPVSEAALAIAEFYDHEQEFFRRAPDWGGDDLFIQPGPRRRRFERTQYAARDEVPVTPAAIAQSEPARPEPAAPPLRRTVTITGRPEGTRRPARTFDQRIAHRPERIASWTCALGALSILLAIVTGQ